MNSAKEIMERLGFKNEASEESQAAFVKNLIKQAYGFEVEAPKQYAQTAKNGDNFLFDEWFVKSLNKNEEQQLSFDFSKDDAG
jgi:hypothetical protein